MEPAIASFERRFGCCDERRSLEGGRLSLEAIRLLAGDLVSGDGGGVDEDDESASMAVIR